MAHYFGFFSNTLFPLKSLIALNFVVQEFNFVVQELNFVVQELNFVVKEQ